MKKYFSFFAAFLLSLLVFGMPVSAASAVGITLNKAYPKSNGTYSVVVKEKPGAKLTLYVNDKNPSYATTNTKDWATFNNVNLGTSTGKISFAKILKGSGNKTYQRSINYVRYYQATAERITFFARSADVAPAESSSSKAVTATPASTPTPVVAPASPDCTNGTYVNTTGNTVCSPETASTTPQGATAQCVDGTYSSSQSRSGTCSRHGGVATWL